METARRSCATPTNLAFALVVVPAIVTIFSSVEAKHVAHKEFGYQGSTGPGKWGTLKKDWTLCESGTKQSPIDISKVEVHNYTGPLKQTYSPATAILQNRGHDFMLVWKDGNGKVTVDGNDYTLQQVHFHLPSEHTINGTRFDMEMHIVNERPSKGRSAIGVLFSTNEAGKPSKTISNLEPYFKSLAGKENAEEPVKEPVDPAVWIDETSGYYRYNGSLTTPPCSEGVVWTIMDKIKHISKEQIQALELVAKVVEHNDRPTQKLNDRVVHHYEPKPQKE